MPSFSRFKYAESQQLLQKSEFAGFLNCVTVMLQAVWDPPLDNQETLETRKCSEDLSFKNSQNHKTE